MQAIAVSAVKQICKTILESFVSMYENHFDIIRNTNGKSTNEEFEIAVNGPNLANENVPRQEQKIHLFIETWY